MQFCISSFSIADIVPVSGLVMNAFVRCEKELGTALELWDVSAREQVSAFGRRDMKQLKFEI